jgi:hypothetical protein
MSAESKPTYNECLAISKVTLDRTGVPTTKEEIEALINVFAQELRHRGYHESARRLEGFDPK